MSGNVPEDLQTDGFRWLGLFADEGRALQQVRQLMLDDLRFEHMKERAVEDATWRFTCQARVVKQKKLIDDFVAEHAKEPFERTCFFTVELLTVQEQFELHGVTLIPREQADGAEAEPGCTTAVPCRGTSHVQMAKRARPVAEHALRVLRATLRDHHFMPDEQLRFRLGYLYWFEDSLRGWSLAPGTGFELELDDALMTEARAAPLFGLPHSGRNDVEKRANRALTWFEQSQLATDSTLELLFLFSALEAILGDQQEGLKAGKLAIRRAMLGLLTRDGFTHPAHTLRLYDKVRSAAVHGEEAPKPTERELSAFAWDMRRALNEFVEFAQREGMSERKQVRAALDNHPRREKVVTGLMRDQPELWRKYVAGPNPPAACQAGERDEN